MPNRKRVQLLVEALRSEQFEQNNGVLARVDADTGKVMYCCLGVACEVAIANGLKLDTKHRGNHIEYGADASADSAFLPPPVREWYGFLTSNPTLRITSEDVEKSQDGHVRDNAGYHNGVYSSSDANDSLRLPFSVIADAFERTFLGETDEPTK